MSKLAAFRFHDAESSEEKPTVGRFLLFFVLLQIFDQLFLMIRVINWYDCIFSR